MLNCFVIHEWSASTTWAHISTDLSLSHSAQRSDLMIFDVAQNVFFFTLLFVCDLFAVFPLLYYTSGNRYVLWFHYMYVCMISIRICWNQIQLIFENKNKLKDALRILNNNVPFYFLVEPMRKAVYRFFQLWFDRIRWSFSHKYFEILTMTTRFRLLDSHSISVIQFQSEYGII